MPRDPLGHQLIRGLSGLFIIVPALFIVGAYRWWMSGQSGYIESRTTVIALIVGLVWMARFV